MSGLVYIARSDSRRLQELLKEKGIPFFVQDGPYQPRQMENAVVLVPGKLPVTKETLDMTPRLQAVSKYGVGLDRIDVDACTRRQILVCNAPTVNNISVAEHAVALLLAVAKCVGYHDRRMNRTPPMWRMPSGPQGVEITGKTVSVIGLGRIGRIFAQLAHGLGMRVVGFDPYVDAASLPAYITVENSLEAAMAAGDFVSIHVAGTEKTRGMIGEKEIARMKETAYLINTTRGFVVDESALARALNEKKIAGAAVDVIEKEPVTENCPLLGRENVIITPHCGANTVDAHRRSEEAMAENIFRVLSGSRPETAINGPF
ncbi:MAG: phosphoglycerate dehydrogenase [Clostridia bacterium]|nr:phosphoglycerate dehydrogenase [Clostridia bacterium]